MTDWSVKMKISETIDQNSVPKKMADTFLTLIDLFCNKYLFLILLINVAIVTKPVVTAISVTNGMYMYYTAETSAIGHRPCRFFGILSGLYPDKYLFMSVFKIMYLVALVLLAFLLYRLIKSLTDLDKKMTIMFGIDIPLALFFNCTERPVLSLAMMVALVAVACALYVILYGKNKLIYFAPILVSAAVLIDVRTVYLCMFIPLVLFVKKPHMRRTEKVILGATIGLLLIVFTLLAIASDDNKNSDEVKNYFEVHYSENYDRPNNYTDEETGEYHMSNTRSTLLSEGFFKVTPIDLITEWIPRIADTLISFLYEDIFQGLCYIYIPVILIYNHLTVPEEKKREIIEANNV